MFDMSMKEIVILVAVLAFGVYIGKAGLLNKFLPG
jgi:hypothetical protein